MSNNIKIRDGKRRIALALFATWFYLQAVPAIFAQTNPPADLPKFRYQGVVLKAEDLKYKPHDDVIFPSVLRMDHHITNAPGKFFMYYAPHDAPGGICLVFADRPEGPWREYTNNPIISREWAPHYQVSHVSGPDAIWNPEEKKVFLYFHGENDTTRLATSADGIHFNDEGAVVTTKMFDRISEASYGRVFRHTLPGKDNRYVMLLMGNNQGIRRIYLAWSADGRKWESQRSPILNPPPGNNQAAGAVYLPRGNHHYVILHANNSNQAVNQGFDLYVAETDAAFGNARYLGKFMDRRIVSPTNEAVMSPTVFEDEGRLYLFFNIGSRLRNKIALAVEEPAEGARH